ncbi:ankyrin repeat domain-containing protein [Paenibacillus psychroresistens]|uniref:Ankyrin repeat domain-containing protein n=1 Tax=Paenibacillus psychroresistens TaxID=1778678 RepID=A0A6B8RM67_9BACL|nr:ankyrin repeat domain-containing protein [Paenibacillus psychroresistens]QGQ96438.1 ankyrin repeat domain-containing protein [Paenibacillus psychroresistens]
MDPQIEDAIRKRDINVVRSLITEGRVDINTKLVGNTYLSMAWTDFQDYDFEIVKLLLDHGADLNDSKYPSITDAAYRGKIEEIQYVLDRGANINAVNHLGNSALSISNIEVIKFLLGSGIDVEIHGGKPLRGAAWDGKEEILQLLFKEGADINYHGYDQVHSDCPTPLQVAAQRGHVHIVHFLLELGADPTIKDKYGNRPYTVAKRYKHQEIMDLIKTYEPRELHD